MASVWKDFFQTKSSPLDSFFLFFILLLSFLGVITAGLLKLVHFLYLTMKKQWKGLKKCLVEVIIILLLPLIGISIYLYKRNPIANIITNSLKISFEQQNVDTQQICNWLNSLDSETINANFGIEYNHKMYDDSLFPEKIRSELSKIKPNTVCLAKLSNNQPYLILDIREVKVFIGIDSELIQKTPYNDYIACIEIKKSCSIAYFS